MQGLLTNGDLKVDDLPAKEVTADGHVKSD